MVELILSLLCLVLLSRLRRFIEKRLHGVFMLFGFSPKSSLYLYHVLVFPGVLLHELSHFLMAALLNVKTGDIELFPKQISHNRTALGSVPIQKTDPFRMMLIGTAPLFAGIVTLYFLTFFLVGELFSGNAIFPGISMVISQIASGNVQVIVWIYIVSVLGQTMFLSTEDTRSLPGFVAFVFTLYLVTLAMGWSGIIGTALIGLVQNLSAYVLSSLIIGVCVSLGLALCLTVIILILQRFLGKRLVYDR